MRYVAIALLALASCNNAWRKVKVYSDYKQVQEQGCSAVGGDQIIAPPKKAMKIAAARGANAIHIQRDIGSEIVADAYQCP